MNPTLVSTSKMNPFCVVAYPRLLLDLLSERGLSAEKVLEGTGLEPKAMDSPNARVSGGQFTRMVESATRLTGDQGLGCEIGLRTHPTLHGFLGYAIASSRSLREALNLGLRFQSTRQQFLAFELSVDGESAMLHLRERNPVGPLRRFFNEMMLIGFVRVAGFMVRQPFPCEIDFEWPRPEYFGRYEARLPPARFDRPCNRIRFRAPELDRELAMPDSVAQRQAVEQCEREMLLVPSGETAMAARVAAILRTSKRKHLNLDDVAARLKMSSRSLERKLREECTTFRKLLGERHCDEAVRLLEDSSLEVNRIALTLGYSEPANFIRAFRKWTGKTPTSYRIRQKRRP